jgi:hypothetical protein
MNAAFQTVTVNGFLTGMLIARSQFLVRESVSKSAIVMKTDITHNLVESGVSLLNFIDCK